MVDDFRRHIHLLRLELRRSACLLVVFQILVRINLMFI